MTWFAASVIIGMRRRDKTGAISVEENVILIEAENADEANRIASERGKLVEGLDDKLTIDGHPAERIFAGVRKLITIANMEPGITEEDPPRSGTEITYSEFEVPDEETLDRLGRGDGVEVYYIEIPQSRG